MVHIRRVYEEVGAMEGKYFLVDGLWPRGVKKEKLSFAIWLRDAAPSPELRKWFGHDPEKWVEFRRRYFKELDENPGGWELLKEAVQKGNVTLLYGAKDEKYNNAVALREYLEEKI